MRIAVIQMKAEPDVEANLARILKLSLIHISEPTRLL